jgi:putative DNA primase/helicase
LRFCHHAGSWFEWNGSVWRREETKLVFELARETCRQMAQASGATGKVAAALAKASTARAVERFAEADRAFAVTSECWDRDPFLLGTPGGTVDLRTGRLRPAVAMEFITKQTAVAPADAEDCPLWLKFLSETTRSDAELIRFLKQWSGYCLTGDIREQALLFVYGPGGNGKGVYLSATADIMGDYCKTADMDAFTASKSDRHPTDLAGLKGARMVRVSETDEGRAWAENRIKQLTGGDVISARFMRQDFFEYLPQFKLFIIGNHKPVLRNVDAAAKRRFNIAPFIHTPPVVDKALGEKLRAEWPGILRWMINGCLDWQQHGLVRPKAVQEATDEYFADQNTVAQWIEDCCETDQFFADTSSSLFGSWQNWAKAQGEDPGSSKRFSHFLELLGYRRIKNSDGIRGRGFKGIKVSIKGPEPW